MAWCVSLCVLWPLAAAATPDAGITWLASQQNADGSFGGTAASLATPVQTTDEVLRAYQALGQQTQVGYSAAFTYLNGDGEANTEYLARKIIVNAREGNDVNALVSALVANQNTDGGFGSDAGAASSTLDTAYALRALAATNYSNDSLVAGAIGYLLSVQDSSGGWADGDNSPSVFVSAQAMRALWFYRSASASVPAALTSSQNFLLAQRDSTGLWGDQFNSALALLAIVPNVSDLSLVNSSIQSLNGQQLADGSWLDDPYTTALAVQAETVYQARQVGGGGTGGGAGSIQTGSISGSVVLAGSTQPIQGVLVTVTELPGTTVQTNGAGDYVLPSLPAGSYTLTASKVGYSSASLVVTVQDGQTTVAGTLALSQAAQIGIVAGTIFDAQTQSPLAGATISFTGAVSYSAVTGANGTFSIGSVAPGGYTVSIAATGYTTLTGNATVASGQTLTVNEGLTKVGGYVDTSPGTLSGTVVNGSTGQPISGAIFDLGNGLTGTTDGSGQFSIAAVPRGSYTGTLTAMGYVTQTYSISFPAGAAGALGTLTLYAQTNTSAPSSLTLNGVVVDGVNRTPVAGATVTLVETGATAVTGADGAFVFSGITSKSFTLATTATGYQTNTLAVSVSAFGQASITVALSAPPPNTTATTSTLQGTVTDAQSSAPISGARISIDGTTLSAVTDSSGQYAVAGIDGLNLNVTVSAVGYQQATSPVTLPGIGTYTLNPTLQAVPVSGFQVLSVTADQAQWGAEQTATFTTQVASTVNVTQNALVIGEVIDANGTDVGTLIPYAEGTNTPTSSYTFAPNETKTLTLPWPTAHLAPGSYRIVVRVVVPGSLTRSNPLGEVLAENQGNGILVATSGITGALGINPPLTQAGASTPVTFSALVRNNGNVPINAGTYVLTITDSTGATTDYTTQAPGVAIPVAGTATVSFGTWVPAATGNLKVTVASTDSAIPGIISGTLYVGDKPTGTFTLDKTVVPEGDQKVHGRIAMQGVDARTGTSVDPLFALVKDAVHQGSLYTGPNAETWQRTHRCLGCHIQTQSLYGIASSLGKANVDKLSADFLYNAIASSQHNNGALNIAYLMYAQTQTMLGAWSLASWPDKLGSFRTKYRAAKYIHNHGLTSGSERYWSGDYNSNWWGYNASYTALTVGAMADLLKNAQSIDLSQVKDYALTSAQDLGTGGAPRDIEIGPSGNLYVLKYGGQVNVIDRSSNTSTTLVSGLPGNSTGLAVASDGTVYVSTEGGQLIRILPDGTRSTIYSQSGVLRDVEIGPDGALYISNPTSNRILRMQGTAAPTVFASGGLLNYPNGIAFDSGGNLLVANESGFNILKISPTGVVSVVADGLAYPPIWLAVTADDTIYVTTSSYYTYYQSTAFGLDRIQGGIAERITEGPILRGVVIADGKPWVANESTDQLDEIASSTMDTSALTAFQSDVVGAAHYFLATYQNGTTNNIILAQRMIGMAEARSVIADTSLDGQLDTAIAYENTVLRQRQRADGGWGHYVGQASDPLVSALVGIAIDYTNPSSSDSQVRSLIQYLLNTQGADGSWPNVNNGLSTRLAATSFVMAYLPKALDRLGGIDVDLHLDVPGNVQLSNPLPAASTSTPDSSGGGTSYDWKLQGVTSSGRNVDFDLTLPSLALNETRPVASTAYMAFKNSFTGETMKIPLTIPSVRAASGLSLTVGTDQPSYGANADVTITAPVSNSGVAAADGEVDLSIHAAGSTTAIATLAPIPVSALAAGATIPVTGTWNTGSQLAGNYIVDARLLDSQGRLAAEATTPFTITAPGLATPATSVHTDKPVYQSWDTVQIAGRVQNVAANALLPATQVLLTVKSPSGTTLFSDTRSLGQLAPLALRDLAFTMNLSDAPSGTYPVQLVLEDSFTHAVLSTSTTSFQVQRNDLQAIGGSATVDKAQVYQGDPDSCTDTAKDLSATNLTGVTLTHQLVSIDTKSVVDEKTETVDLTGGGAGHSYTRAIDSGPLALGGYACVLKATINGQSKTVAYAGFKVVPPPIRIDSTMALGHHGRLLVLLDPSRHKKDDDEHCDDVTTVDMKTQFAHPVSDQATMEVTVTGADGTVLDHEYTPLAGFTGPFNGSPGAQGVDLEITDFTADGLGLALVRNPTDPDLSTAPVQVHAVLYDGGTSTTYDSGAMPCACSNDIDSGVKDGAFTIVHIDHKEAANDAGVTPEQQFLEPLLTKAGWSYTIVHSGEAFEHELHTGGYAAYLLLAKKVKLEETTQQELREAVFRGEGLVVAGNHDARDLHEDKLDDALGIKSLGVLSHVVSVQLTQSPLGLTDLLNLTSGDDPQEIQLTSATSAGMYVPDPAYPTQGQGDDCNTDSGHGSDGHIYGTEGTHGGMSDPNGGKGGDDHDRCTPPSLDAVALNDYGQGKSAYAGFDLLEMAMDNGPDSPVAKLLLKMLDTTHPATPDTHVASVVPVEITLTNKGIAVPVRVTLPLPAGTAAIDPGSATVNGSDLVWNFPFAKDEVKTLTFWLRLPITAGDLRLAANVEAQDHTGTWKSYSTPKLTISVLAAPTADEVIAGIKTLDQAGTCRHETLEHLTRAIEDAQRELSRHPDDALHDALKATDALAEAEPINPAVAPVRVLIDQWIKAIARTDEK